MIICEPLITGLKKLRMLSRQFTLIKTTIVEEIIIIIIIVVEIVVVIEVEIVGVTVVEETIVEVVLVLVEVEVEVVFTTITAGEITTTIPSGVTIAMGLTTGQEIALRTRETSGGVIDLPRGFR